MKPLFGQLISMTIIFILMLATARALQDGLWYAAPCYVGIGYIILLLLDNK